MGVFVTKADASRQLFDRAKIVRTCLRNGASRSIAEEIAEKIEAKLYDGMETRKILDDNSIEVTATAVRVPVTGGHSESVNVEFRKEYELYDIKEILDKTPGVIVNDNPAANVYPMAVNARGKDEVFVGRVRKDYSCENALNMWIVADNLRKGAATNAIQIAEILIRDERRKTKD